MYIVLLECTKFFFVCNPKKNCIFAVRTFRAIVTNIPIYALGAWQQGRVIFSFQGLKYLSLQGTFFIAFRQQAHKMTEAK